LYFFDIGILGAISKLSPKSILDYDYGTYKGYFCRKTLLPGNLYVPVLILFFCWREGTSEVEFLREIDGKIFPIEIKSGWVTRAKSLDVFFQEILTGLPGDYGCTGFEYRFKEECAPLSAVFGFPFSIVRIIVGIKKRYNNHSIFFL